MHNIIQETSSIDKYALIGDIKNPEGVLYIMPVMNDYDIDNAKESILSNELSFQPLYTCNEHYISRCFAVAHLEVSCEFLLI